MDKTDRLRDYGLAFLLYEQGLGLCGYELIRELFIFIKLILNSYLSFLLKKGGVLCLQISIMKTLIRCQELKYYFTAFCLLLGSIMPIDAQTIRQIEVSFPILKGKMKLQGVVSQVAEAPQQSPILVLVTPPQAFNRDYVGFFKALSDSLNRKGYTTFRYDNRSYSDTLQGNQPHEGCYTMYDAADDLHDALAFLKSDERFASHPVGVIGHSEGGSVAIIEASRNTEVKQLLLLATMGVKGEQVYYEQIMSRLTPFFKWHSYSESNILRYMIYRIARILASEPRDKQAIKELQKEMAKIYQQHASLINSSFGVQTQQEFVKSQTEPFKNDARLLAAIRYNPEKYLQSIRCPIFIAYAKNDNLLNYIEHQKGIECTLLKYQHFNFFSIAIDDANHSFEDQEGYLPLYVSVHRKESKLYLGQAFTTLLDNITKWLQISTN